MAAQLVHPLLTLVLPLICGFLAARLALLWGRRRDWLVLGCLAANFFSIALAYVGFLALIGVTTGSWPDSIPAPAGLAYALAWFAIPTVFTSVPLTVGGYICGILTWRQQQKTSMASGG